MRGLQKVFELHPGGINWPRAVLFLDIALVPLVVFWSIGYEQYLLSALFGLLCLRGWTTREAATGTAHRTSPFSHWSVQG